MKFSAGSVWENELNLSVIILDCLFGLLAGGEGYAAFEDFYVFRREIVKNNVAVNSRNFIAVIKCYAVAV